MRNRISLASLEHEAQVRSTLLVDTEGRARPSRRSLQGGKQRQKPLPTPTQLGWVFTRKGRESTRQHLQGGKRRPQASMSPIL
uniref:Uncharacterized protein n=1 Tax=Oryza barthii TaxID=65489 RepID=A0A0D3HKS4_9ORYZ